MTKALFALLFALLTLMPLRPAAAQSNCDMEPRLLIGYDARVTPGDDNRVRSDSSTSADVVGVIPAGEVFQVVGFSRCQDGFRWWQINYGSLVGWTVEGADGVYWVEPVLPELPTMPELPELTPSAEVLVSEFGQSLRVSADGQMLVTEAVDGIERYALPALTPAESLTHTGNALKGIAISADGTQVAACVNFLEISWEANVMTWTPAESTEGSNLYENGFPICEQTAFRENELMFVAQDGLYGLNAAGEVPLLWQLPRDIYVDMVVAGGDIIAVQDGFHGYYLFDLTQPDALPLLLDNPDEENYANFGSAPLALTPSGDRFARRAGVLASAIEVYAVGETLDLVTTLQSDSPVTGLALNADGSLLASIHQNGNIYLWNVASGTPLARLPAGSAMDVSLNGLSLAFNPLEPIVYTLAADSRLRAWDISGLE